MRATSILIIMVGIAVFGAACATGSQRPAGPSQPAGATNSGGQQDGGPNVVMPNGLSPNGLGPSSGRSTGLKIDTVRVIGGQLFTSDASRTPAHD